MQQKRVTEEIKTKSPELVEIIDAIKGRIAEVTAFDQHPQAAEAHLEPVARLLESLPLAAHEFGVAKARVSNACRYFQSNENGAARYELRLLLGQLDASRI